MPFQVSNQANVHQRSLVALNLSYMHYIPRETDARMDERLVRKYKPPERINCIKSAALVQRVMSGI